MQSDGPSTKCLTVDVDVVDTTQHKAPHQQLVFLIVAWLLGSVFIAFVLAVAICLALLVWGNLTHNPSLVDHLVRAKPDLPFTYGSWTLFLCTFGSAAYITRNLEQQPVRTLGLGLHSRWLVEFVAGSAMGIFLALCALCALSWLCQGRVAISPDLGPQMLGWGVTGLLGMLGIGLSEEFIFRGYLLQTLQRGTRPSVAAAICTIGFSLFHLGSKGSGDCISGFLRTALFGLLMVVLMRRTRSLWLVVGLHTFYDWGVHVFTILDARAAGYFNSQGWFALHPEQLPAALVALVAIWPAMRLRWQQHGFEESKVMKLDATSPAVTPLDPE